MLRNRYKCNLTAAPGSSGDFAIGGARAGFKTFGVADDGLTFDVLAVDGAAWEIRADCSYTHLTRTLTRGTLADSSAGSAVTLSEGTILAVILAAHRPALLNTPNAGKLQAFDTVEPLRLGYSASVYMKAECSPYGLWTLTALGEGPGFQFLTAAGTVATFISQAAMGNNSGANLFLSALPTPTAANQRLGFLSFGSLLGGDLTTSYRAAAVSAFSTEAWDEASGGAYLIFATTANGTRTRTNRMYVHQDGKVSIAKGTASAQLDVNGDIAATEIRAPALVGASLRTDALKTLTENVATAICDIAIASNSILGAAVEYTIEANDGTDYQARKGRITFAAVNKAGAITVGTVTDNLESNPCSAGTLSSTATVVAGTGKVTVKLNATSSLTQTVLRVAYRTHVDGSNAVTAL